jgi:hypothetical protein
MEVRDSRWNVYYLLYFNKNNERFKEFIPFTKLEFNRGTTFCATVVPIWTSSLTAEQLETKTSRVNGFQEPTQSTTLFSLHINLVLDILCSVQCLYCTQAFLKPTGFTKGQFRKIIVFEYLQQDTAQLHCTDPCLALLRILLGRPSHTMALVRHNLKYSPSTHMLPDRT